MATGVRPAGTSVRTILFFLGGLCVSVVNSPAQDKPEAPSFGKVYEIFARNCASCHNPKELKGEFSLETYEGLMKGGGTGPAVVPGKPAESLLLQQIEHRTKPFMPPPKKGRKLSDLEIAVVRAWIEAGAKGLKPGEVLPKIAVIPKIEPKVAPRKAIQAVAFEPKSKLLALARLGEVELRSAESRAVVRTLGGHAGPVNAAAFSADGAVLAAAGGEPGVGGEVRLWNVADGKLLKTFKGHEDAVYSLALAPDGKTFATGGYDHLILLWDRDQDKPVREFQGHNEAVMSLAFRPDGKILASASADRTVKLWDVATGERRDTLGESTKALHAVAFSPDGKLVAAGGVDNRIRLWTVSGDAKEGTNPLRSSSFAHEGAILKLAWSADGKTILSSADDRTVKLWNAPEMAPKLVLETQSDWPTALAFLTDAKAVAVGRLDGTFQIYDAATGKIAAAPKPELTAIEPRGLQRGTTAALRLSGKNLAGDLKSGDPGVRIRALDGGRAEVTVPREHAPGEVELWLSGPGGESGRVKLFIDTLPQVMETEGSVTPATLPASLWGALSTRGNTDTFSFDGVKGQKVVVDAAAKRIGSKAELTLTLTDAAGRLVASNIDFEGESDPLIVTALPADGKYLLTVGDLQLGASPDHYYRLSVGDLPVVTGVYPLAVPANAETAVRLVGANLPADAVVQVKSGAAGEAAVPVDPEKFRQRRELKVLVSALPEVLETEDNDLPAHAVRMPAPGAANGRIDHPGDTDLYRFDSKAGQVWAIETQAAQRGSPADTRIDILHADGRPVERVILRAVRDSYLTFRPVDANQGGGRFWHWQEMDLGQYLYLEGEVVKLFLAPQGPDSEWKFFTQGGKRRGYFDTSATAHPLDAPAYIVEPHPPGTKLPPNGLPLFPLYYSNDDDADRKLGTDSKLIFTAPADGAYLVRVRDTRGAGGDRYVYRLVVRPAKPDFRVFLEGANPNVPLGSGTSFTLRVDRIDGYEGPVRVEIAGLPEGFTASTPVVIEAGHLDAKGALFAAMDCTPPASEASGKIRITASASPEGREVTRDVNGFGALGVAGRPRTVVWLEPDLETGGDGASADPRKSRAVGSDRGDGRRITVNPGGRVSALLKIQRSGHNERVTFDVENLPFGVIVDDIGLNGILIPEGATERRIFLTCAASTPEALRPCYARIREGPNPTSSPVLLRVPRR
jgi:WD40 repeat protein/mono/diheme cytochrome c family protein